MSGLSGISASAHGVPTTTRSNASSAASSHRGVERGPHPARGGPVVRQPEPPASRRPTPGPTCPTGPASGRPAAHRPRRRRRRGTSRASVRSRSRAARRRPRPRCWKATSPGFPTAARAGSRSTGHAGSASAPPPRASRSTRPWRAQRIRTRTRAHRPWRVHSGQTGVSSTTSVPCARRSSAARGPVSSRIVVRSCCAPMNERLAGDTEPIVPSATSSSSRSTG